MELKPCPFCGADGRIHKDEKSMLAYCDGPSCLVSLGENYDPDGMPDHAFYEEEVAIAAWNTRTPDPLIAQLTEALEALRKRQLTDGIPCFCETYYPGRTHNSSCAQARAALAAARKR